MNQLQDAFGGIDIYLFDQLLKGRLRSGARVLDAGCGGGRNLVYLLQQEVEVWAVDANPARVAATREVAEALRPSLDTDRIRQAHVEDLPFPDGSFDFVISSAVLHFAPDEPTFLAMVDEMWRVLAPEGILFVRLASTIGIEDRVVPHGGRRFRLPDGSDRFLVDQALLSGLTARLGGRLLDPIKTTVVQDQRAMTTWVVIR